MTFDYSEYGIRIEHIRNNLVEEFHEGILQIGSDSSNGTPYYLRSCAKPLQAALLVDYGIDLTPEELALCCGSHAGEECHIEVARKILNKTGLDESYLKCGIHAPLSRTMQDKMLISGEKADSIHNNCSGKHIGFLAVCKKNGWDLDTYYEPEHPLQKAVKNKINELCEVTEEYPVTTDGCGVPILSMPLQNMVKGFINLSERYPQIIDAIRQNPYIFGGENRTDTEIIQKTDNLIAKVGAGGICVVLNIKKKEGFAVKINDCSYEARRIALFETINKSGWGNIEYDNGIYTLSGKKVGYIRVTYLNS